jgi:fumarate hydratase subunit beta
LFSSSERVSQLPFSLENQIIFYAGPTPSISEGDGVIGPTTSSRMDKYVEPMLKLGVKGFLGKGPRSRETSSLVHKYQAIYLATVGGAAALLSKFIKSAKMVFYHDLGPEAIYYLDVAKFPAVVAIDVEGKSIFESEV